MSLTTERGRVAHLLRRATFGASKADIDQAVAAGLPATIEALLNPATDTDDIETVVPRTNFDFTRPPETIAWWLMRMIRARHQFLEKMTFFWHGHLTSALSKTGGRPDFMIKQIDTYRGLALGSFRELVIASAKSPAMLLWLDGNQNRRNKPNENFARELMELFTLGIGNYTETDIREAARAFTGWFQRAGEFIFVAQQHDNDSKTVLGYTGNWNGEDVVDILLRQPAAGRFIARKLWSFFAYPNPETEIIDEIAGVLRQSNWDIRTAMRAIFSHPAFYSEKAYHALIKSPVEYTLGLVRGLSATTDFRLFGAALPLMGQVPLNPPNVEGWPGGEEWVSTTALIARYNFANQLLRSNNEPPVDVAGILTANQLTTRDAILDFFVDLMLDGDLPAPKRQVLADYLIAKDDGTPGTFTLDERTIHNKVRGLIYLIAATAEYQLN